MHESEQGPVVLSLHLRACRASVRVCVAEGKRSARKKEERRRSSGECTNAAVMSNNPMYQVSFEFLLAANANSVRATASGGVPAKTWPTQHVLSSLAATWIAPL